MSAYPKMLYHTDGTATVVASEEETKKLPPGWSETPPDDSVEKAPVTRLYQTVLSDAAKKAKKSGTALLAKHQTHTYADGTTVTGTPPFPKLSPKEQAAAREQHLNPPAE